MLSDDIAVEHRLGLAVAGEPANHIAAAQALKTVLIIDPTARVRVPQTLLAHADIIVQLVEMDSIAPEEIIKTADWLTGMGAPGAWADQPTPALRQLAKAETNAAVQKDAQSDTAAEEDAAAPEVTENKKGGKDERRRLTPSAPSPSSARSRNSPGLPKNSKGSSGRHGWAGLSRVIRGVSAFLERLKGRSSASSISPPAARPHALWH